MELLELLELLRSDYYRDIRSSHEEVLIESSEVYPEIAFRISDGVYKNLYIVDLIKKDSQGDHAIEIAASELFDGGGMSFEYNDLEIVFGRVSWEAVRFSYDPKKIGELDGFEIWFDRWLDLERARAGEGAVFGEVIHSALFESGNLEVDFGTATTTAFLELLNLISKSEADRVAISSSRH